MLSAETPRPNQLEVNAVLTEVLHLSDELSASQAQVLKTKISKLSAAWEGGDAAKIHELLGTCVFVEIDNITDGANFRQTVTAELSQRRQQNRFFEYLQQSVVPRANSSADFQTVVEAYIFLRTQARPIEKVDASSFLPLMRCLLVRAGELCEDKFDATAPPKEIAELVWPALLAYAKSSAMAELYDRVDGPASYVGNYVMRSVPHGCAEVVAGEHIRSRLRDEGYYVPPHSDRLMTYKLLEGRHYLTAKALRHLHRQKVADEIKLPKGNWIAQVIADKSEAFIRELATTYTRAVSFVDYYDNLKPVSRTKQDQSDKPFEPIIVLANKITGDLNQQISAPYQLNLLAVTDVGNVPIALDRLVYAIKPTLLAKMRHVPFYRGNYQCLTLAYIEAMARMYRDRRYQYRLAVGDLALHLSADGMTTPDIKAAAQTMNKIMTDEEFTTSEVYDNTLQRTGSQTAARLAIKYSMLSL